MVEYLELVRGQWQARCPAEHAATRAREDDGGGSFLYQHQGIDWKAEAKVRQEGGKRLLNALNEAIFVTKKNAHTVVEMWIVAVD